MTEINNYQHPVTYGEPLDGWATSQSAYQNPAPQVQKKSNFGCIVSLLIATIIAAVMIFTCPGTAAHKEALTDIVSSSVTKVINENTADGLIAQGVRLVGNMVVKKVVDTAVDNLVTVDNYIVCSVGKVNYDGKDHIVSVGLLGHIFTVNQESVADAAEEYYLNTQQRIEKAIEDGIRDNIVNPLLDSFNGLIEDL